MFVQRRLVLPALLAKKSLLFLGPRSTGKSALIRQQLPEAKVLDLLSSELYLRLSASPHELEHLVEGLDGPVVIDEVQRVPELLNEVHRLIESTKKRFLLTGSSARKLRRKGANLLAGRAWRVSLFPLTYREIVDAGLRFDLDRYLRFGGLPQVYLSDEPEEELQAYVGTYLREEIQAEAALRKLPAFSRFLKTAALCHGQVLNYASVASDAAVAASTVRDHYGILDDTLMGQTLTSWKESKIRKAVAAPKFFFFDPGIVHTLAGTRTVERNSNLYGQFFEHFVAMEVRAYLSYRRAFDELTYWRSTSGFEVDLLVGDHTAIEIKATNRLTPKDRKGLLALREEGSFSRFIIVSHDEIESWRDGIHAVHWQSFLDQMWDGKLF